MESNESKCLLNISENSEYYEEDSTVSVSTPPQTGGGKFNLLSKKCPSPIVHPHSKDISYTALMSLESTTHYYDNKNKPHPTAVSRNALSTLNGVYIPCLLNIIGVIIFLRLGWAIGQAGLLGMLVIFAMAELQAVLTVLSASAIASNGTMKGGGSYYMISRSLGPEFGGAIGIQFYLLYAVGIAFYLVGLGEAIQQSFFQDANIGQKWVIIIVASIGLILITGISIIGAKAFARINHYLFIIQFASILAGVITFFCRKPHILKGGGNFTGISMETLKDNLYASYTDELSVCGVEKICNLQSVYAIVFPLATGFMEGVNLSGDLKNPGRSLPLGTLSAIGTACLIYVSLMLVFASSFTGFTLRNNLTFFQEAASSQYIIIVGIVTSCFSSALGSLFGASRILQAISRDNLFKSLAIFSQGSKSGDEPQYAVIFSTLLAEICILIGDLDLIAPICTSFFCLAYFGVNLSCFILQVTGVPNYRPTFKYSSWHFSLLGVLLNLGVMIYLNALYSVISLFLLCLLFVYLYIITPPTTWGDVSQALIYHQVRKYLLRLDSRKSHKKFWRPSILLLVHDLNSPVIELCSNLKKGGLYILGDVVAGNYGHQTVDICSKKKNEWVSYVNKLKIKAIPQVVAAITPRSGYEMLVQCCGLGGMQINTVALPWFDVDNPTSTTLMLQTAADYVGILLNALFIRKNIILCRHCEFLNYAAFRSMNSWKQFASKAALSPKSARRNNKKQTIDIWLSSNWSPDGSNNSYDLSLQLAYILHSNPQWKYSTDLRVIQLCSNLDRSFIESEKNRMMKIVVDLRIQIAEENLLVLCAETFDPYSFDSLTSSEDMIEMNKVLQINSTSTRIIFLMLPNPQKAENDVDYLSRLKLLTNNLPPTLLIWSGEGSSVVSTCI